MFWMAAGIGMNILGGVMQNEANSMIAKANYELDLANQALQNQSNKQQVEKAYNRDLKVQNNTLAQLSAANDAQIEANTTNTLAAHYKAGLIKLQQGLAAKQAVGDRQLMKRTAAQALGSANANAAASGTIGSSVDAVAQDIEKTLGEALVQGDEAWAVQSFNYKTALVDNYTNLEQILGSGQNAAFVMAPERDTVILQNGVQMPNLPSAGDIITGGLIQGFGQYATMKANLGLGKAPITDLSRRMG